MLEAASGRLLIGKPRGGLLKETVLTITDTLLSSRLNPSVPAVTIVLDPLQVLLNTAYCGIDFLPDSLRIELYILERDQNSRS